jgi:hypothetical protein
LKVCAGDRDREDGDVEECGEDEYCEFRCHCVIRVPAIQSK